jgi:hypothetical protein
LPRPLHATAAAICASAPISEPEGIAWRMLYSHTILTRKSLLGTVWIATHFEDKLMNMKSWIDRIDIAT